MTKQAKAKTLEIFKSFPVAIQKALIAGALLAEAIESPAKPEEQTK